MIKNTGKALENLIYRQALIYRSQGLLTLEKVDPPTRTINSKAGKITTLLSNPFPDFIGCLNSGRMLCIEAKSNHKKSLPFGKSGLRYKQIDDLYMWSNAGAIVGIIWQSINGYYWVTLDNIRQSDKMGRRSIPESIAEKIDTSEGKILNFYKFIK